MCVKWTLVDERFRNSFQPAQTDSLAQVFDRDRALTLERLTKKRPVKSPGRFVRSVTLPKESSGERLHRSYDLPYCALAPLTHESLAVPASASHFSIATL
jgi:hypothetical protein